MLIMSSTDIQSNYEDVLKKCKESGEPIYLTNSGKNELVVMDVKSFEKREQNLQAQQLVLDALASRLAGERVYSLSESKNLINKVIEES